MTYDDLSRLALSECAEIREAVASHPNTSGATLHYLATTGRPSAGVVAAVIDNPATLEETYRALAEAGVWDLRLAGSKRTPRRIMEGLTLSRHLATRDTARDSLDVLGL